VLEEAQMVWVVSFVEALLAVEMEEPLVPEQALAVVPALPAFVNLLDYPSLGHPVLVEASMV
jgi:hypothetical protein